MGTNKQLLNHLISEKTVRNPSLVIQINQEGEVLISPYYDLTQSEHLPNLAVMILGLLNGNLDKVLLASLPVEVLKEIERLEDAFDESNTEIAMSDDEPVVSPYQTLTSVDENSIDDDDDSDIM